MESWRTVWRNGVAPVLSDGELDALLDGLRGNDPALIQGNTTTPPPLICVLSWPCEAACAIGYAGWRADGLKTVGKVEEFFGRVCFLSDQRTGKPADVRWLLNWFDDTPRPEMIRELLAEVERAIEERADEIVRAAERQRDPFADPEPEDEPDPRPDDGEPVGTLEATSP